MKFLYTQLEITNIIIISLFAYNIIIEKQRDIASKAYFRLMVVAVVCNIVDLLGWLFDGATSAAGNIVAYCVDALNLAFAPLFALFWIWYLECFITGGKVRGNKFLKICSGIVGVMTLDALVSPFTGWLFYLQDGVYCRGPLYKTHMSIVGIILVCVAVRAVFVSRKSDDRGKKKDFRLIAGCVILILTAAVIQVLAYGLPLIWTATTCSIVLVYVRVQNKRVENIKMDFFARMSHDLRTPLNGILGLSSLAIDEIENQPLVKDYLEKINDSGQFMLGIVNDILEMRKLECGNVTFNPKPYSKKEYDSEIQVMFTPLCKDKDIELVVDTSKVDKTVLVDKLRLRQILLNLISNSVKYTNVGGKIEVLFDQKVLSDTQVVITIVIRDNGIGMSKEFLERIYDVYQRSENVANVQGSGLGLAITKSLVDLMGGTIHCESEENVGTTFTIELPLEYVENTEQETALPEKHEVDDSVFEGKRVLLVEDHPTNTIVATELLKMKGMVVEHAENGKIAVDMFECSNKDYYDLVLMDVMMPVMGGLEATQCIRALANENAKTIPIIAMTANAFDDDIQKCLAAGMNAHIAKPIDPEVLFSTLQENLKK